MQDYNKKVKEALLKEYYKEYEASEKEIERNQERLMDAEESAVQIKKEFHLSLRYASFCKSQIEELEKALQNIQKKGEAE